MSEFSVGGSASADAAGGSTPGLSVLDDRSLAVLQRVLLTTDGTVVPLLEGCFDEPIRTAERVQGMTSANAVDMTLELERNEEVLRRRVLLQGTRTRRNYIYAESSIVLHRLPAAVRDALLYTEEPIGRLLVGYRVETFREVLRAGRRPAGAEGSWFGVSAQEELLFRTYRVWHGGRPAMLITEIFPSLHFLGQGGGAVERDLEALWDLREELHAPAVNGRATEPLC